MTTNRKGLLIDLDGTLYHGDTVIEGASAWIQDLQSKQIPYLFVTNNSSRTPQGVADHLTHLGIPASAAQVCTSAMAAAYYIAQQSPASSVYVIGEDGLKQAATEHGLQLTEEQPDYVLQGIDRQFTYEKLTKALRLIAGGAKFILTNPDLQLPSHDGLLPGAGTIGASIVAATGIEPVVIGKPSAILMEYALERLGLPAKDAIVVGDNLLTDIAAGAAAGCVTVLVLSGITTTDNISTHEAKAGVKADIICQDLAEVISALELYSSSH
ncbi:TIGR01457 family HAD-type hydrolase [Paenibacillus nicotianae]|uniref:Acid sugar phosphatase n=1 Tax=Paenibacillus nicotianae TaxID=1526551 RepID=A0ABW4USX4_9BACL